jgi:hypothetical protein
MMMMMKLYTGSHSSKDTVLRADSISSKEQEELQESETQGIIEVFHAVCNLNQTYLFNDDPFQDFCVNKLESKKKEIDYQRFQPYFLNVPVKKVKKLSRILPSMLQMSWQVIISCR